MKEIIYGVKNLILRKLKKLNQLKVDGIINKEEFELKKKQFLKLD